MNKSTITIIIGKIELGQDQLDNYYFLITKIIIDGMRRKIIIATNYFKKNQKIFVIATINFKLTKNLNLKFILILVNILLFFRDFDNFVVKPI